jgi:hypothetical protein
LDFFGGRAVATQLSLIEAHESTINQIFSDAHAFEIPAYRRNKLMA